MTLPFKLSQRAVRLGMLVVPSLITLGSVSITAAIAFSAQERELRDTTAERVQEVASSLAELDEVRGALEGVANAGTASALADADDLAVATDDLQPLASLVENATGVYYVVVTDDEGVRITHPDPAERGVQVSTANASVLAGEPYLGTEEGASGPSLRAKVPVFGDDGAIVGMVAVGVLESSISAEGAEALGELLPWTIGALVLGTLASSALAFAVERRFRRLDALAAEHAQMQRTTTALREQSHEFSTRMHVVHGLVSRGDAQDALEYIDEVVPVRTAGVGAPDSTDSSIHLPLLDATTQAVRAELHELGAQASFDLELDDDIDDGVVTVIANLCRNAGEAGASRVRCTLRESDNRIVGLVDDDGPGLDAEASGRIFTPGFSSKADPTGLGRGIGLELVRRTVTSRGGTIEVGASRLGGSRFAFEIERLR